MSYSYMLSLAVRKRLQASPDGITVKAIKGATLILHAGFKVLVKGGRRAILKEAERFQALAIVDPILKLDF